MKIPALILFVVTLISFSIKAQDVHFSQPENNLLFLNPAFTGINNKYSFNSNYRNQWGAVNTPYTTYNVSGDYRFGDEKADNYLAVGAILLNDITGDGSYRTTNGGIALSYHIAANKRWALGAGINYNINQASVNYNKFSWGNQFNGQSYDASLLSTENAGVSSKWYSDLNAGISLSSKASTSTLFTKDPKITIGYSINHINQPSISMNGGAEKLYIKHTVFINMIFPVKENISIKPTLLFYQQGTVSELTFGGLVNYKIGQVSKITGIKKGSSVAFGALYRVNDAIIPTTQFEKGNYVFGLSYDINVSSLTSASRLRGGVELSFRITNVGNYLYKDKDKPKE